MPTLEVEDRNAVIRPGYLVSLKTTLIGNISYHKQVLEREHIVEDGSEQARWETKRVIGNREEHTAGFKAQSDARAKITQVCTNTAFGLFCPSEKVGELQQAIREAKQISNTFNRTARFSRTNVYVIVGKVVAEEFDIVTAMATEALQLLTAMKDGIRNRDKTVIREAANELRQLSEMFSENGQEKLQVALSAGRGAARKIVKAPDGPAHALEGEAVLIIEVAMRAFQQLVERGVLQAAA